MYFLKLSILGLIGIPLGLLLGILASTILIIISNLFYWKICLQED